MSRNYDNWERLVAAVIKREEDWQLCHQLSIRTSSMCFEASSSSMSDFGSSSNYFQVSDDFMFENNVESAQKPVPKLNIPLEEGLMIMKRRQHLGKGTFGKGTFGSSFLTRLQRGVQVSDEFLAKGTQLVMKKLQSEVLNVTEEEFSIVFGNCRHENVAVPRAYHFSDKGNFIFNDYHGQGSVYDLLHGYPDKSDDRLNWESRVKIAVGAARGIAHIHGIYGGKLAHGNVKSSNIFVNSEKYGRVSDFGLAAIIKSPGKKVVENASQESDIYCFGVVLLQLLLGRSSRRLWEDIRLVKWARSITPEDWNSEWTYDQSLWRSELSYQRKNGIFCDEYDMIHYHEELEQEKKIKAEMLEMLQVAIKCFAALPQHRPKMLEVVLMLENHYAKIELRI